MIIPSNQIPSHHSHYCSQNGGVEILSVCFKKHGFWGDKKLFQFSHPHFEMGERGNFWKIWMKKGEKRSDEKNSLDWPSNSRWLSSCALMHQELCIRTCKQALGIPVVLVYALNSTDAAIQSDISEDYIWCFLINIYFVFCPFHVKFCMKWQHGSEYFPSLSFSRVLFTLFFSCYLFWCCIGILVIPLSGLDPLGNASHRNTCYQILAIQVNDLTAGCKPRAC